MPSSRPGARGTRRGSPSCGSAPPPLSARSGGNPVARPPSRPRRGSSAPAPSLRFAARISPWSRRASSGHATRPCSVARARPPRERLRRPGGVALRTRAEPPRRAGSSRRTPSFWLFAASGRAFASAFSASARPARRDEAAPENRERRGLVVRHLLVCRASAAAPASSPARPGSPSARARRARDRARLCSAAAGFADLHANLQGLFECASGHRGRGPRRPRPCRGKSARRRTRACRRLPGRSAAPPPASSARRRARPSRASPSRGRRAGRPPSTSGPTRGRS